MFHGFFVSDVPFGILKFQHGTRPDWKFFFYKLKNIPQNPFNLVQLFGVFYTELKN